MSEHSTETKQPNIGEDTRQSLVKPMRPAVDILEDERGITLEADMPGVSREGLEIHVDRDTLAIEGRVEHGKREGFDALYADIRSSLYQRSFTLSHELDGDKAEASLKDGVLRLHIPKREQYQPRKIEVLAS